MWCAPLQTYNQGTLVVLLVLLEEEDIDAQSRSWVEKGEDADGDKEFGRGGVVTNQEDLLLSRFRTLGGIKVNLVESEGKENLEDDSVTSFFNAMQDGKLLHITASVCIYAVLACQYKGQSDSINIGGKN